jgi:hypothetical protein
MVPIAGRAAHNLTVATDAVIAESIRLTGAHRMLPDEGRTPMGARYSREYMTSLPSTIAAGTSDIQRNIIATRGLACCARRAVARPGSRQSAVVGMSVWHSRGSDFGAARRALTPGPSPNAGRGECYAD